MRRYITNTERLLLNKYLRNMHPERLMYIYDDYAEYLGYAVINKKYYYSGDEYYFTLASCNDIACDYYSSDKNPKDILNEYLNCDVVDWLVDYYESYGDLTENKILNKYLDKKIAS